MIKESDNRYENEMEYLLSLDCVSINRDISSIEYDSEITND